MTTLAERLAPHLYGVIMHPGDADTEPFPVMSPLAGMSAVTMPKGMAEDVAEENGLPHTDFARLWLEAVIALIENEGQVTLVPNTELAERDAELKHLREAAAPAINAIKRPKATCGAPAGRAIIRDLHTDEPTVPCSMIVHDCRRK